MKLGGPDARQRLAWCETSTAGALTPNHLRALTPGEALRTGGGLFIQALCGRDLAGGWDLAFADPHHVADRLERQPETARVCIACAHEAQHPQPRQDARAPLASNEG